MNGDLQAMQDANRRIAELEAENARLKEECESLARVADGKFSIAEESLATLVRERDEARAQAEELNLDLGDVRQVLAGVGLNQGRPSVEVATLIRERDEARAACVVKDRALAIECPTCRAKPGAPDLCADCLRRRAALSSTAGAELLARLEKAEAERDQLREELRLEKRDSDEFALSAGAQLETMRGALERLQDHHCSGLCDNVPDEAHEPVMDLVNAALSPSSTRMHPEGVKTDWSGLTGVNVIPGKLSKTESREARERISPTPRVEEEET